MGQYLPIVALAVLATAFAAISLVMSRLLAPRRPSAAKRAPYESGILPTREPPERFPVRFYLVAMIFIVFDVEIILLFPWAVDLPEPRRLRVGRGPALLGGRVRELRVPDQQWRARLGAAEPGAPASPMVSPERTTRTTIRRVGLEGRPEGKEAAEPVEPAAARTAGGADDVFPEGEEVA